MSYFTLVHPCLSSSTLTVILQHFRQVRQICCYFRVEWSVDLTKHMGRVGRARTAGGRRPRRSFYEGVGRVRNTILPNFPRPSSATKNTRIPGTLGFYGTCMSRGYSHPLNGDNIFHQSVFGKIKPLVTQKFASLKNMSKSVYRQALSTVQGLACRGNRF